MNAYLKDTQTIIRLVNLLESCRECLDNYSDGEYVDGRPTGNTALHLVGEIDEAFRGLSTAQKGLPCRLTPYKGSGGE